MATPPTPTKAKNPLSETTLTRYSELKVAPKRLIREVWINTLQKKAGRLRSLVNASYSPLPDERKWLEDIIDFYWKNENVQGFDPNKSRNRPVVVSSLSPEIVAYREDEKRKMADYKTQQQAERREFRSRVHN